MFQKMLEELREGSSLDELTQAMRSTVAAVRETGKPGMINLQLKVKPGSRGCTSMVIIEDIITTKIPTPEKSESFFFATKDNDLQKKDPAQLELNLREIETPERELKEID